MTSATVGGTIWSYAYRGDGLRDSATTGGTTRTFSWDVNAGLPVILDDGSQYIYGAGLVAQISGANTYYYLADGLGSTMATTDASGAIVNSYTYDVYGKTTASSGSQPNDFQFAAQQTDPTGLQYLRARYYDPETGAFVSRDPLAIRRSWIENPFTYAASAPTLFNDPTGQMEVNGEAGGGAIGCDTYCWLTADPSQFGLRLESGWFQQLRFENRDMNMFRICQLVGEKTTCDSFTGAELQGAAKALRDLEQWFLALGTALSPQLQQILNDDWFFNKWLNRPHPKDKVYDPDARDAILKKLDEHGIKWRCDSSGVKGQWANQPHINIEGRSIHIPVSACP